MADRNATLKKLKRYVESSYHYNTSCQVKIASWDMQKHQAKERNQQQQQQQKPKMAASPSYRAEHGPFAGVGYLYDVVLASKARNGFAGVRRSSSYIVLELIEYDRRIEAAAAADIDDVLGGGNGGGNGESSTSMNNTRTVAVQPIPFCVVSYFY